MRHAIYAFSRAALLTVAGAFASVGTASAAPATPVEQSHGADQLLLKVQGYGGGGGYYGGGGGYYRDYRDYYAPPPPPRPRPRHHYKWIRVGARMVPHVGVSIASLPTSATCVWKLAVTAMAARHVAGDGSVIADGTATERNCGME